MKPSDRCFELIYKHEPFISKAVRHKSGGHLYGYGHFDFDVSDNFSIREDSAFNLLRSDLYEIGNCIQYYIENRKGEMKDFITSQNQFDALISFIYDVYRDNIHACSRFNILDFVGSKGASIGIEMLRYSYYLSSGHVSTFGTFDNKLLMRRLDDISLYYKQQDNGQKIQ